METVPLAHLLPYPPAASGKETRMENTGCRGAQRDTHSRYPPISFPWFTDLDSLLWMMLAAAAAAAIARVALGPQRQIQDVQNQRWYYLT